MEFATAISGVIHPWCDYLVAVALLVAAIALLVIVRAINNRMPPFADQGESLDGDLNAPWHYDFFDGMD